MTNNDIIIEEKEMTRAVLVSLRHHYVTSSFPLLRHSSSLLLTSSLRHHHVITHYHHQHHQHNIGITKTHVIITSSFIIIPLISHQGYFVRFLSVRVPVVFFGICDAFRKYRSAYSVNRYAAMLSDVTIGEGSLFSFFVNGKKEREQEKKMSKEKVLTMQQKEKVTIQK